MVTKLIKGRTVGLELIQRGFATEVTATQGVSALKPDSAGLFCFACIMLSNRTNIYLHAKKGSFIYLTLIDFATFSGGSNGGNGPGEEAGKGSGDDLSAYHMEHFTLTPGKGELV